MGGDCRERMDYRSAGIAGFREGKGLQEGQGLRGGVCREGRGLQGGQGLRGGGCRERRDYRAAGIAGPCDAEPVLHSRNSTSHFPRKSTAKPCLWKSSPEKPALPDSSCAQGDRISYIPVNTGTEQHQRRLQHPFLL